MKTHFDQTPKKDKGPEGSGSLRFIGLHGRVLGHVLGRPGKEHLLAGFEQETSTLDDDCRRFFSHPLSDDPGIVLAHGRLALERRHDLGTTATWHALHGLFWHMASVSSSYVDHLVLFGAQSQVHLTDALHHLDEESIRRLYAVGLVTFAGKEEQWYQAFRGACAAACLSRALRSCGHTVVLPREDIDRLCAVDLLVPQSPGRCDLLCIQVKGMKSESHIALDLDQALGPRVGDISRIDLDRSALCRRMALIESMTDMDCRRMFCGVGISPGSLFEIDMSKLRLTVFDFMAQLTSFRT